MSRRETNDLWFGDPGFEGREREASDAVCVCGHPAWQHTAPAGKPGDCLHRSRVDDPRPAGSFPRSPFRFDCACEVFTPQDLL